MVAEPAPPSESSVTVLLALAANAGIAVLKVIAGLLTGSAALLSEAAHSVGDSVTEVLLLTALRRSRRPADKAHPFGHGKERYVWSLLAAVGILVFGAAYSFYEGLHTILGGPAEQTSAWVNYLVLALSFVLEAISFNQSFRQLRREARREVVTIRGYLRDPEDPTVKSVVLEDTAALIGLVLAFLGVGLHQLTGAVFWDGAAALAIGILLVGVAFTLLQTNMGLLIGKQANIRLIRRIRGYLEEQPEVEKMVDLLTMMVGTGRVLLCVRLDFDDNLTSAQLELVCVRIDNGLRAQFAALDEVFLEPVPRTDQGLRARVLARYGDVLDRPPAPY
ncbi:MAG: cation transporter [Actinobacteria bacterium 13_1_20CM_3_71_11]|nr:MAG: cation transporter [Actinobacteria bacterium 13_1_20CM_3_71_11]